MQHPLVILGAGPTGLAAAAQAQARGIDTIVLEAGTAAGTSVREWGHVRLFSPWSELIDPIAEKLLAGSGWVAPDPTSYPSGNDWVDAYLAPLAQALEASDGVEIRYAHRVVGRGSQRPGRAGRRRTGHRAVHGPRRTPPRASSA